MVRPNGVSSKEFLCWSWHSLVCPARDSCAGAGTVFMAVAATIDSLCKHQNVYLKPALGQGLH